MTESKQSSPKNGMSQLIDDLWYMRRDIISDGYDRALDYINKILPLKIHEIPTGTKCWTWTVPEKWSVKSGSIETLSGKRLLDINDHPLHILSYSLPIDQIVTKEELFKHLHSKPALPHAIPFEFKYYERDWGFCIQHNRLQEFTEEKYRVYIDSEFSKGTLKAGDFTIPGQVDDTVVLISHLCHPAQVNDDLTGVSVLVDIAKMLAMTNNYYTYKCLFVPETIGSIAYLSQNEQIIPKLKYGIFLEMLGTSGPLALQLSRQGDTRWDHIARYVLSRRVQKFKEGSFRTVVCNDEMVFNGPGVNVPTISISRYPYPQYHTSDDNPAIISENSLYEARDVILNILRIFDKDFIPKRQFKGPIFLSGHGLWVDWRINQKLNANLEQIMLRLEGDRSVFDIASELDMPFEDVLDFIMKIHSKGLIAKESLRHS